MLLIQKEYQERLTVILLTEVYQEIEGKRLPNSFKGGRGWHGECKVKSKARQGLTFRDLASVCTATAKTENSSELNEYLPSP